MAPFLHFLVGWGCLLLSLVWVTLSLPVYLFRLVVGWVLAPGLRPDLGPILDLQSAALSIDYLDTRRPPRCHYVVAFHLRHAPHNLFECVKRRLQRVWVEPALTQPDSYYRKLGQVPTTFLGFPFWQPCPVSVEQHVSRVEGAPEGGVESLVEQLLNTHCPRGQSPWNVVVVEDKEQAVMLFRIHHCLVDGFGMLRALHEAFNSETVEKVYELKARPRPAFSLWRAILGVPDVLARLMAHTGRHQPCRVPDGEKKWHQLVVRSGPISIDEVKRIKNYFGVTFTSVLLSALLSATRHALEKSSDRLNKLPYAVVFSALPLGDPRERKELVNCATGSFFQAPLLPSAPEGAEERLRAADLALESARDSAAPLAFQVLGAFCGAHCCGVMNIQNHNRWVTVGLTNFSGLLATGLSMDTLECDSPPHVQSIECFAGALGGDAGIAAMVLSHHNHISIQMSAEEALFSKEQLQRLTRRLVEEVEILGSLVDNPREKIDDKNSNL